MKKTLLVLTAFCLLTSSFASFEVKHPGVSAKEIFVPIGKDMQISLMDLSAISVKDFQTITGKHLNFVDKLAFKTSQKKLRNTINADGTVNSKKFEKFAKEDGSGFNIGGFALGFFLGLIGVLIAYIINNDNNQSRRKWAWFGLLAAVVLSLIVYLVI